MLVAGIIELDDLIQGRRCICISNVPCIHQVANDGQSDEVSIGQRREGGKWCNTPNVDTQPPSESFGTGFASSRRLV